MTWLDWVEERLGRLYTWLFEWATDFPALALTLLWLAVIGGCVLLAGCAPLSHVTVDMTRPCRLN